MTPKTLNNLWPGETVFIIGGGPSLIGFDFSPIMDRKVIGVNIAFKLGDWVDVCWFGDLKFFKYHRESLKAFSGYVAHCNLQNPIKNINWMFPYERGKASGIDERKGYVAWNRCSGFSAINLAYHMGAKTVVLLGFDMSHNGNQRNWHKEHDVLEKCSLRDAETRYSHYMICYPIIKKEADKLGLSIINCNPDSKIEAFDKMTLKDFLQQEANHA